jgi:hypothetical protein
MYPATPIKAKFFFTKPLNYENIEQESALRQFLKEAF